MKLRLLAIATCVSIGSLYAQSNVDEKCSSHLIHHELMDSDPDYRQRMEESERLIQEHMKNNKSAAATIYTIPLVVHVIHTGQPVGTGANISDAQVYSAIHALNEDYRKIAGTLGDGNGADTEIEFCLAQTDPQGNATTGINRVDGSAVTKYATQGIVRSGGANETQVKNLSRWPNDKYYNIWIVTEIDNNNGQSGVQGYAYFPGASAARDGATILYNAFGTTGELKSYTKRNRTTTHELGHGLNLYHTFEGDDGGTICPPSSIFLGDRVADTPAHIRSRSDCPSGNNFCVNSGTLDEVVHNYMDYSSETCQSEFTAGQKDRMRAALETQRKGLLESNACNSTFNDDLAITKLLSPSISYCGSKVYPKFEVKNIGKNTITSFKAEFDLDGTVHSTTWTGSLAPEGITVITMPVITGLGSGGHTVVAKVSLPNGQADPNALNNEISRTVVATPRTPVITLGTNDYIESSLPSQTYIWLRNNIQLPEFNTRSIKPTWDGEYRVIGVIGTCPSDTSDPYGYYLSSVETHLQEYNFQLYPNPTDGQISLSWDKGLEETTTIQVFNLLGEVVTRQQVRPGAGNTVTMNLNGYGSGMYLVQLQSGTISYSQKVFVK